MPGNTAVIAPENITQYWCYIPVQQMPLGWPFQTGISELPETTASPCSEPRDLLRRGLWGCCSWHEPKSRPGACGDPCPHQCSSEHQPGVSLCLCSVLSRDTRVPRTVSATDFFPAQSSQVSCNHQEAEWGYPCSVPIVYLPHLLSKWQRHPSSLENNPGKCHQNQSFSELQVISLH